MNGRIYEALEEMKNALIKFSNSFEGVYMDEMLTEAVNARVSCLRKSYKKARWKKRYKRWYKSCSKEELHQIINFFKRR